MFLFAITITINNIDIIITSILLFSNDVSVIKTYQRKLLQSNRRYDNDRAVMYYSFIGIRTINMPD